MKTNRFFLHYLTFAVAVWLTILVLGLPPVVKAQTFTGREKLDENPASFKAMVYPVSNEPATIRINIDNQSHGFVRIQIIDQPGKIWYDEFEGRSFYRQPFDLSFFPPGVYTIRLSNPGTTYTTMIRIEPPTPGRITSLPKSPADSFPNQDKRIVSF